MGISLTTFFSVSFNLIKMFGDLKSAVGVKALDEYLAEHSYIEGFVPSQADTAVYKALAGAPKSDTPHALRWYNHIKSFAAGMDQFPKASKDASAYVSGGAAAASKDDDDDDDVDLSAPMMRRMTRRRRESPRRG